MLIEKNVDFIKKNWFFSYIVFLQSIYIKDKQIKAVKLWLKLKLIRDIRFFLNLPTFIDN